MNEIVELFDQEVVAGIERRYAAVPEYARPALWSHGTQPQHGALRTWLNVRLAEVPSSTREDFVSRLLSAELHTQALAEIAAGSVLQQPGYTVEFGPDLGGRTPDLLVTDPEGRQLIGEVWRRGLSKTSLARNGRWAELARAVRRISVPVALAVESSSHDVVEPPDDAERAHIERALRGWLKAQRKDGDDCLDCERLAFRIVGTTTNGRAELLPVWDSATADRKDVIEAIERKVKRYRSITDQLDLAFVVVLSADDNTGMDADHVDNVLAGKNPMKITIPRFGVGAFDSGPIEIRQTETPPLLDTALSAVAWLEVRDGAHAQITRLWPNPRAQRPVEPLASGTQQARTDR